MDRSTGLRLIRSLVILNQVEWIGRLKGRKNKIISSGHRNSAGIEGDQEILIPLIALTSALMERKKASTEQMMER